MEHHNRVHPGEARRQGHVARCLAGTAPVVAATDHMRAWPQSIAGSCDAPYTILGTDGYGRSDTRAALRRFFEVGRHHIVLATLDALVRAGRLDRAVCAQAVARYGFNTGAAAPWNCRHRPRLAQGQAGWAGPQSWPPQRLDM